MNTDVLPFLYFAGYFILFVATAVGLAFWLVKRRVEMPPIEFRLRRSAGESLRRRVQTFDETAGFSAVAAALVPVIVSLVVLRLLVWFWPEMRLAISLSITGAVGLIALVPAARWLIRRVMRARDDRLAYLGDRAVAESLQELVADGYRVFHDVPTESRELEANLDHVAVGPKGVFAIETRSRRQGLPPRAGADKYKVVYDENRLIWPWNEDDLAPRETTERARWLSYWVKQATGIDAPALPVLVIPGWYVETNGTGPVLVVNHKQLFETMAKIGGAPLDAAQINLIAIQLDQRCRDVKD